MSQILFIDGENFINKLEEALKENEIKTVKWKNFDFRGLFDAVLKGVEIDRKIFYFSKLSEHPDTRDKSKELIETWRLFFIYLGFENNPNKGLTFTTNKTILIRNSEILRYYSEK